MAGKCQNCLSEKTPETKKIDSLRKGIKYTEVLVGLKMVCEDVHRRIINWLKVPKTLEIS